MTKVMHPIVDRDTPYERDVAAQLFVDCFDRGASHESIADAMGMTRENVLRIEMLAIRKLVIAAVRMRLDLGDGEALARTCAAIRADELSRKRFQREHGYRLVRKALPALAQRRTA